MQNSAFYKPNTVQIELVQGCNRRCSFCRMFDVNLGQFEPGGIVSNDDCT